MIVRALAHRDYRFFMASQVLSLFGFWVQTVAQMWLMYRLTDQAFAVAWVAIAQQDLRGQAAAALAAGGNAADRVGGADGQTTGQPHGLNL